MGRRLTALEQAEPAGLIEPQAVPLAPQTGEASPCFVVTGLQLSAKQLRKLEARIGARIIEDWVPEVTHLVTDTFRSTLKLMCSICVGAHIVTPAYLDACQVAGSVVDEAPHLLRDELCEAAFAKKRGLGSYSLQAAVELARHRGPLLAGVEVICSESVARQRELEAIVRAAGGSWLGNMSSAQASS